MTIPFQAEGQLLPVSPWLKSQLAEMVSEQSINLEPLTALTFRFNDPNYSATQGGYHPVEIRLVRASMAGCSIPSPTLATMAMATGSSSTRSWTLIF